MAYDMLKNQGVIRETPPPLPPEDAVPRARAKSAIFEDEEKSKLLQKLLQSKKPEDIQHANCLIKTMVKEVGLFFKFSLQFDLNENCFSMFENKH